MELGDRRDGSDGARRGPHLVRGLLEAARVLNAPVELDEAHRRLLATTVSLLEARAGSVMVLDGGTVRVAFAEGLGCSAGDVYDAGSGVVGRAVITGEPLLVPGELLVEGRGWLGPAPHGAMSVPLFRGDAVIGVLNATAGETHPFDDDDLAALSAAGQLLTSLLARRPHVRGGEGGAVPSDSLQGRDDAVTGLANRELFTERVNRALHRASATAGPGIAVLLVDLDDFKRVNDSWSHATGDELLRAVAQRLDSAVRDSDTVARLSGDEFAVLVEGVADPEEAVVAAERLREVLSPPFTISGRAMRIKASFGVVVSTPETSGLDDMLHDADIALFFAKTGGKDRCTLFEEEMQRSIQERVELEADLGRAVERNELVLHYQPIFALETGRINGFEALVRWQHPEKGMLAPDRFIPMAEETGMIVAIDRWVLLAACTQGKAWQDAYPNGGEPLQVGVNLSVRQLEHDSVVDTVALALEVSGLAPEHLTLEITESFVLQDESESARRLALLRELGVRIAIDDFGTGYASLSYLRRLPVDILKVDRSFVDGLGRTPEDTALVRAILRMATSLNLGVTAEGVETQAQLSELKMLGCSSAQGYHFSHPLPSPDFDEMLRIRFGGQLLTGMLSF
jgi:diguanylate cyclase (GGDEF)-like protein